MIIFLDEERGYRSWVVHHREGFVVDWLRRPTRQLPTLHRATCKQIREKTGPKSRWTTGRHVKACSLDRDELVAWAVAESGKPPVECPSCQPDVPTRQLPATNRTPITKLGHQILDFVVEIAIIHLDRRDAAYRLTVEDVAGAHDKTVGQIADALNRLVRAEYLCLGESPDSQVGLDPRQRVYPTARALQMLPDFEKEAKSKIDAELAFLRPDTTA